MSEFKASWMLYGATGTTGSLIARAAAAAGESVVLGSRDAAKLETLAGELKVRHRVVDLDQRDGLDAALSGVRLVLNCAGPFALTANTIAQGCMRTGAHYLDISGGMTDHRSMLRLEDRALESGIMLCPGVGADVMPSDCLALHVKQRLPSAIKLDLGFAVHKGGVTRPVLADLREALRRPGYRIVRGELVQAPETIASHSIDFGTGGKRTARAFPWRADALAASRSTGIHHIETWAALPLFLDRLVVWHKAFETTALKRWLDWEMNRAPMTPPEQELKSGRSYFSAIAVNESGVKVCSTLQGPGPHRMAVITALAAVKKALTGDLQHGFVSPAQLLGPKALTGLAESELKDVAPA